MLYKLEEFAGHFEKWNTCANNIDIPFPHWFLIIKIVDFLPCIIMPSVASIIGIGVVLHANPYSNNAYNLECYTTCTNPMLLWCHHW